MTQNPDSFAANFNPILDIALWIDPAVLASEAAFARHLVMGLKSDGHAVTFLAPSHLDLATSLPLLGSRMLSFRWNRWERLAPLMRMRMAGMIDGLTAEPPDVLVVWAGADPAPLDVLQQTLNIPTIAWCWDAAELFTPLARRPYVKRIVVSSEAIRDRVPTGFATPVNVIHPGVYTDDNTACYDVESQVPCLVSLDPLSDRAAYEPLLRACRMLADENLDFWLFAYDTGAQEHPIWQLAEQLRLLDCIGFVPFHHEAEPLLLQGDLFIHVLPSTRVQYRTLEAMARGLTVIAPPNTAADYLKDGHTARIMTQTTPEAWHKALRELIVDRPKAIALARKGQQLTREHHSLSRMTEQFTTLCRQVAGTPIPMAVG